MLSKKTKFYGAIGIYVLFLLVFALLSIGIVLFFRADVGADATPYDDQGNYWSVIRFDGGLNNKQNPLDIADNEAVYMDNFDIKEGYLYKRPGSVMEIQPNAKDSVGISRTNPYPALIKTVPTEYSKDGILYHNKYTTTYFSDATCTPAFTFASGSSGGYAVENLDPFSDLQVLSYSNALWFMEGNGFPPMRWDRKKLYDWAAPTAPYVSIATGETGCTGTFRYAYSQMRGNTDPYEYPISDWSDEIELADSGAELIFTATPGLHITNRKIYRSALTGDTRFHFLVDTITNTEPNYIVTDDTSPNYPADAVYGGVHDAQTPRGKYTCMHYQQVAVAGILGLPSCIWFSEPGDPISFPQRTRLFIDSDNGDKITAIAPFQGNIIALQERHLYKVVGTNINNYQYLMISDNVGCVDAKSVKIFNDILVWSAADGLYGYDGNTIRKLSTKIDGLYSMLQRPKMKFKAAIIDTYDDWNEGTVYDTGLSINSIDIKNYPGFLVMDTSAADPDSYVSKTIRLSDKIKQWGAITVAMSFERGDSPSFTTRWQPYAPRIYYRADTESVEGKAWEIIHWVDDTSVMHHKYAFDLNYATDYGGLGLPTNFKFIQFRVDGDTRDTGTGKYVRPIVIDNIAVEWAEYSGGNLPHENQAARDTVCVPSMVAEVYDNHYWLSADIDTGVLYDGIDTAFVRKVLIKMSADFKFTTYWGIDGGTKSIMTPSAFGRYGEYLLAGYAGRRVGIFALEQDTSLTRNSWSDSVGIYSAGGSGNTYPITAIYRTKNFDFGFPIWEKDYRIFSYTFDVAEINTSETLTFNIKYKTNHDTVWSSLQDTITPYTYGYGSINRAVNFPHGTTGTTIQFEYYDNTNRAIKLQRVDLLWNKNLDIFNRRK